MRRDKKAKTIKNKIYLLCIYVSIHLCVLSFAFFTLAAHAEQPYTLKAGVSMMDRIPDEFYGTWRVVSTLISSNNEAIFKNKNVDLWNLSREENVITLENPFSGAKASIKINSVEGSVIKFKKTGDYDGKKLSDVVELTLGKDSFKGINTLTLETVSQIDGHVMSFETAQYKLTGEKISGSSIRE